MKRTKYKIEVFGKYLVALDDSGTAARYAQAIREGMWQCTETGEPWRVGAVYSMQNAEHEIHVCGSGCCDTWTVDNVMVVSVEVEES